MDLSDAIALLGIELPAEPAVVRRAYLRLLRTTKPEVDPDGFMRLRDAYELVRAVALGAVVPVSEPRTTADSAPSLEKPSENPPVPIALAPTNVSPSLFDEDDAADVGAYRALGAVSDAAEILDGAFRRATRLGVFDGLPIDTMLDVLTELHERNLPQRARALGGVFTEWLEAGQLEARGLDSSQKVQLAFVRELDALSTDLPRGIRRILAVAAKTEDFTEAVSLARSAVDRSSPNARMLVKELRENAPLFSEALFSELVPDPTTNDLQAPGIDPTTSPLQAPGIRLLTYAAMGVLLAIGLLVFCDTNDKIALRAVEKLEGLAERDHLPFSGTLRDLKTAIVRRNCQDMDSEVLELSDGIRSRARRGGVSSEHDVALSELREAVRKVCGSHGTR